MTLLMEDKIESIEGSFTYCIYKSFNYGVYRFKEKGGDVLIVTGNIQDVDKEAEYILYGCYVDHPKYGIQFNVSGISKQLPSSYEGIIAYLSSDLFKGIGIKKAQKIADRYGLDTLRILRDDADVLKELDFKEKDINTIKEVLNSNLLYEESYYFLMEVGLDNDDIRRLINFYKENTEFVLKSNPYQPYFDISYIGFRKCELLAQRIGFDLSSKERYCALLAYLTAEMSFKSGNTYFSYAEIKRAFYEHEGDKGDFAEALAFALAEKTVYEDTNRFYNYIQYRSEQNIASFLCQNNVEDIYDHERLTAIMNDQLQQEGIRYNDQQKAAIVNFFKYKISLLVGGPGTGKTTVVKALSNCMRQMYPAYEIHIVAPTGRAAKRISELCGVSSSTIHSLLKWDKETNTFSYNADNPLLLEVLIIDEFSMVDNWLFARLIEALANVKKICVIGDDNQLPSVGAGNLLKDILKSDRFPLVRLNTIFRQEGQSDIITLSADILNDTIDFAKYGHDVYFIDQKAVDPRQKIVSLIGEHLAYGYAINDIQVLSPMYKGGLGIDSLNNVLQNIFNPFDGQKKEFRTKFKVYRVGDKILQLKNQSNDDVYNGDIGEIVDMEDDPFAIVAVFDDMYVEYTRDEIVNMALAYCISVHKAQGSEYPIVIMAVSSAHNIMLNKNLLYTAVSRASSRLFIVGDKEAFINGSRRKMTVRKTSLDIYINELYNEHSL